MWKISTRFKVLSSLEEEIIQAYNTQYEVMSKKIHILEITYLWGMIVLEETIDALEEAWVPNINMLIIAS